MGRGRQSASPMTWNEPELYGYQGGNVQVNYTFTPSPIFQQVSSPRELIARSCIPRNVENLLGHSKLSKLAPGVLMNATEAESKKWIGKCEEYRDNAYAPEQSYGEPMVRTHKNDEEIHDNDNGHINSTHTQGHRQNQADPEDTDPEADESDPEFSY